MAVRACATSSAFRIGRPLIARTSSPARIPATNAGPLAATSSTVKRPGTTDSATTIPSQPLPTPADLAVGVVIAAGGGATGGRPDRTGVGVAGSVTGVEKGRAIGSPIEISPASNGGGVAGASAGSSARVIPRGKNDPTTAATAMARQSDRGCVACLPNDFRTSKACMLCLPHRGDLPHPRGISIPTPSGDTGDVPPGREKWARDEIHRLCTVATQRLSLPSWPVSLVAPRDFAWLP